MLNLHGKITIFYSFQNDSNTDYNVTLLKDSLPTEARIIDAINSLPLDIEQGRYHYRFKSEFVENDQKMSAWIDISNLQAKVPIINESIYIKILTFKDALFNKLFTAEKIKHAIAHRNQKRVAQAHRVSPTQNIQKMAPNKPSPPKIQDAVNLGSIDSIPNKNNSSSHKVNFIDIQPQKPVVAFVPGSTPQQNLQVFQDSIKQQSLDRENEKIAKQLLQDKINKWGYTEGKKVNNTPTLLATLHEIWPEWPPVSLTDMLKPEQVTALFKKVVIKVHPDKNRSAPPNQKYLAKRVFELINESRKM